METVHGHRNWTDSILSKNKKTKRKSTEVCRGDGVVKTGYNEELKHLSRLQQWRVDVPHHGRPSRSQGLTTRSAISAENYSCLLTFSRRQTRGSLRVILRISWCRWSRYKEIEEDKEEFKEWEEVDIAAEERKQARVVGRQCCRCYPPRPARAAPAQEVRASKSLFRDLRRRQPWKQNLRHQQKSNNFCQKARIIVDDTLDINSTKIAWILCMTQYRFYEIVHLQHGALNWDNHLVARVK